MQNSTNMQVWRMFFVQSCLNNAFNYHSSKSYMSLQIKHFFMLTHLFECCCNTMLLSFVSPKVFPNSAVWSLESVSREVEMEKGGTGGNCDWIQEDAFLEIPFKKLKTSHLKADFPKLEFPSQKRSQWDVMDEETSCNKEKNYVSLLLLRKVKLFLMKWDL